jgi:hypothetical protein
VAEDKNHCDEGWNFEIVRIVIKLNVIITNIDVYSCYDMLLNNNKDNMNDEFDINMVNERAEMYKKRETKVNGFNDRTGRLVGQMRQVNKMGQMVLRLLRRQIRLGQVN